MAQMRRQKVAVCGSGGLGRYIAEAVLNSGEFDLVVLSRYTQPDLTARGIKVKKVDYNDLDSLHDTLYRQRVDTVISVIPDPDVQLALISACVSAGVLRFVPAEFETSPSQRPMYLHGGRLTVLRRLDELRESRQLESTTFSCGLFMEYFAPGGWQRCGGGGWNDGTFLVDMKHKKAVVPSDLNSRICLTSAVDVAQFVCAALTLPRWPAELKMYGDRLRLKDILVIAQHVRGKLALFAPLALPTCPIFGN
ncbi:hypothetical protein ABW19_dt0208435 [Dactylella cylindrospora]|nr:hypothetical protein ABW19_dt0208435 [Dactylella cylindrospora]